MQLSKMDARQWVEKVYRRKYGRPLLHFLFWLFIFVARYYIGMISLNPYKVYPTGIALSCLYATTTSALAYYSFINIIYRRYYKRGRYPMTALAIIIWLVGYACINYTFEALLLLDNQWRQLMIKHSPLYYEYLQQPFLDVLFKRIISLGILFELAIGLTLPLTMKMLVAYGREQLRASKLAKQNVELEFNFLKSQVNPHFLFNTLNNIYSLIIHDKKEQSADTVARLSSFMRYSLYDAAAQKTKAENEIQLLKNYIELEKIRLNHIQVTSNLNAEMPAYELPPLLFIPLVENAFKFCPDLPGSLINIEWLINANEIYFQCTNTLPDIRPEQGGGIGITNTTKRLQQFFPGSHSCRVTTDNQQYCVTIKIDIDGQP